MDKEQQVIELYINQKKTIKQVIDELRMAGKTIIKILKKRGYNPRGKNDARQKNIPKETLENLYLIENKSISEISKILSVGKGTVHNYLKKYQIPIRLSTEAKALRNPDKYHLWTDELKQRCKELLSSDLTYKEAAAIADCNAAVLEEVNRTKLHVLMSIWQDKKLCEEVRAHLEKSRNYAETAKLFNISESALQYKNLRDWHIDLSMNSTLFGTPTELNGVLYRSKAEAEIAKYFIDHNIKFEYVKSICEKETWTCDFYLSEYDLWIEYDGLGEWREYIGQISYQTHPKIKYYQNNGYHHMILKKRIWREQLDKFFERIKCPQ